MIEGKEEEEEEKKREEIKRRRGTWLAGENMRFKICESIEGGGRLILADAGNSTRTFAGNQNVKGSW